jgi:8-oxo-dGTP pyrophosphatase MutT (NUDIX family)
MCQKYRIYINQKVVLLTESVPKSVEKYQNIDPQNFDLKIFYNEEINKKRKKFFFILCDDAKAYLKKVKKSITVIKAAGGLVKNEEGEYLFIFRNGKWDLPKGKIEAGEKIKEAAVREVEEECGIEVSKLGKEICKTYHVYTLKGEPVLKKTYWFRMKCKGAEKLKPQIEEGITEVRWFKPGHVEAIEKNTFPSILDVLLEMGLLIEKPAPLSE